MEKAWSGCLDRLLGGEFSRAGAGASLQTAAAKLATTSRPGELMSENKCKGRVARVPLATVMLHRESQAAEPPSGTSKRTISKTALSDERRPLKASLATATDGREVASGSARDVVVAPKRTYEELSRASVLGGTGDLWRPGGGPPVTDSSSIGSKSLAAEQGSLETP